MPNRITQKLPNGITLVYEHLPYLHSFNIGAFFKNGSLHEPEKLNGITHCIEHLLFKRTTQHSNKELLYIIEGMGGDFDAFTEHEGMTITLRILKEYWRDAISVLFEILQESLFDDADIIAEKNVIHEEIAMYKDTPQDYVYEMYFSRSWPQQSHGRPILGTHATLETFDHQVISEYYSTNFTPANMILSVAGDVPIEDIYNEIARYSFPSSGTTVATPVPVREYGFFYERNKELQQEHVLLGFPCVTIYDDDRFAVYVLNALFGATDFSILNQEIRESRGVAYSVYSDTLLFSTVGSMVVYAAYSKLKSDAFWQGISESILNAETLITDSIIEVAKRYVSARILFSLDAVHNIMEKNGSNIRRYGSLPDYNALIARIQSVTKEDVMRVLQTTILSGTMSVVYYGTMKQKEAMELWNTFQSKYIETITVKK